MDVTAFGEISVGGLDLRASYHFSAFGPLLLGNACHKEEKKKKTNGKGYARAPYGKWLSSSQRVIKTFCLFL
jgi:hypothetical protein